LNRDKLRSRRNDTRQARPPPPREHQTRRNAVPPRDLRHNRAGRQRLFDDPHLIVARPATTTLNPAQDLYPHLPTLRLALKLDPRRIPATQQGGPPRRNTLPRSRTDNLKGRGATLTPGPAGHALHCARLL